jgi:hypothetical protein
MKADLGALLVKPPRARATDAEVDRKGEGQPSERRV